MYFFIVILSLLFLNSCSPDNEVLSDIVTTNVYEYQLWNGNNFIEIKEFQEFLEKNNLSSAYRFIYDSVFDKLWVSTSDRKDTQFFYEVNNNSINMFNPIKHTLNKAPFLCYINKNECLYWENSNRNIFKIINLENNEEKTISIDYKTTLLKPYAFVNNKIFFYEGYYDIVSNLLILYRENSVTKNLDYLFPNVDGTKLVALSNDYEITIVNLSDYKITKSEIKRPLNPNRKYLPVDIFYLNDNDLYFSKDISSIFDIPIQEYSRREWYKFNLINKNTEKITVYSDFSRIMKVNANMDSYNK